jgi:Domain of unknown function (DUF4198)
MGTKALCVAVLACSSIGSASAHDTWFERLENTERGEAVLALGTGNQFPAFDTPLRIDSVKVAGCGDTAGKGVSLRWMADQPTRMLMRTTRPVPSGTALSCLARLATAEVSIDNPTVELYFKEVQPSEAVRARWARLRDKGVKWQESYTKLARIMMPGNMASGDTSQGLDLRVENTNPVLRVGDTLQVQMLRNGQPLPGIAMELRNDLSPIGIWRKSDEQGRISFPLPLAARWMLRGVDLRPASDASERWESDFLSVAFEVLATQAPR